MQLHIIQDSHLHYKRSIIVVNTTEMDAQEVIQNWSDIENDDSEVSSESESEESEESSDSSSAEEDSPEGWREIPGLYNKLIKQI